MEGLSSARVFRRLSQILRSKARPCPKESHASKRTSSSHLLTHPKFRPPEDIFTFSCNFLEAEILDFFYQGDMEQGKVKEGRGEI